VAQKQPLDGCLVSCLQFEVDGILLQAGIVVLQNFASGGDPSMLTGEQKSKIRKSIASIQVCRTPAIISLLLTSSGVVPSFKWQLPQSASLDPLSWGQTGQLILVHFQRHLALKDPLRQRRTIFSHGLLMQNSGIWTFSAVGLKMTMSFEA
jgi:hypothetical protein